MNVQDCEQLTLFPVDSPVSPSVWLESKEAKGMSATFGLKCSELSPNLRRVGSSVRTYLESCELPPGMWSRIWSVKAMTSRCLILKLRLSERRTEENGSRLLPTVTASVGEKGGQNQRDSSGRPGLQKAAMLWQTPNVPNGGRVNPPEMSPTGIMPDGRKRQVGLEHQVKMVQANLWPTPRCVGSRGSSPTGVKHHDLASWAALWPTPDTMNYRDGSKTRKALKGRHELSLHHAVSIWPTPTARDYKDGTAQSCQNVPENGLLGRAVHSRKILGGGTEPQVKTGESSAKAGGQLNPTWVEWLMGFPLGWTDLNVSETL